MSESTGAAVVDEALESDPALQEREVDETEKQEIEAASQKAGSVEMVPIALIEKSEVALRSVNRQTEDFQNLVRSIKQRGVLNSILVRKVVGPGGVVKYGLIDGLQRFTAAGDAGLIEIPARVVEMSDAEMLEAQIITNMNRIQTKPAELSKHLLRMLARNPLMTVAELAEKVCQSKTWIEQRLSLTKLKPEIQQLVNESQIHLTNAYALSKIPEEEQADHVDAAMSESPKTFVPRMKARVKEIRDAKNQGKDSGKAEFRPTQHLQKVGDVKKEYAVLHGEEDGESALKACLEANGIKVAGDAEKAVKMTLAWLLHFDPEAQKEQKAAAERRAKKKEEEKARLKKEREAEKERKAAEKAADITTM